MPKFIGHTEGILISESGAPHTETKETRNETRNVLAGQDIVALAHDPGKPAVMLAGSYGRGLYRSEDGGTTWNLAALDAEYIRTIAFSPCEPGTVYVGIEPAELFRSRDSGKSWECLHVRRLPGAADWSLPYSPRGGALRTVALHPTEPRRIYAGVEQGGVVQSCDGGMTWSIEAAKVDKDVHWLSMNRSQPDVILCATGDGLFLTRDGGSSWSRLLEDYTRAVIIHPLDPSIALAGPAHEVGRHGRIIQSLDGGELWDLASDGLNLPMDDMVEHFVIPAHNPNRIFAVRSGGGLLHSDVREISWKVLPCDVTAQCIEFVEPV